MKILIVTLLIAIGASSGWAEEQELITEVIVTELDSYQPYFSAGCNDLDSHKAPVIISPKEKDKLSTIINAGKMIWKIIEDNQPRVNISKQSASALPKDLDWTLMQCWSRPTSKSYEVIYKNGFGMKVVSFVFQIQYSFGGNYKGRGQYLKEVTIIPTAVDILWGYNFDASITTPSVTNINSSEAPVAGMELQITWTVSTKMKFSRRALSFFVTGEGGLQKIGD